MSNLGEKETQPWGAKITYNDTKLFLNIWYRQERQTFQIRNQILSHLGPVNDAFVLPLYED